MVYSAQSSLDILNYDLSAFKKIRQQSIYYRIIIMKLKVLLMAILLLCWQSSSIRLQHQEEEVYQVVEGIWAQAPQKVDWRQVAEKTNWVSVDEEMKDLSLQEANKIFQNARLTVSGNNIYIILAICQKQIKIRFVFDKDNYIDYCNTQNMKSIQISCISYRNAPLATSQQYVQYYEEKFKQFRKYKREGETWTFSSYGRPKLTLKTVKK